jgi:4'-phosphopantetheinyl transferase
LSVVLGGPFVHKKSKMKIVRWAIRVGQWQPNEAEWTRAAALIQPEEKERIGKFFFKKDAKSSMVGRLLIRKFLIEASGLRYSSLSEKLRKI